MESARNCLAQSHDFVYCNIDEIMVIERYLVTYHLKLKYQNGHMAYK